MQCPAYLIQEGFKITRLAFFPIWPACVFRAACLCHKWENKCDMICDLGRFCQLLPLAGLNRVVKQEAVAAAHHFDAMGDKATGLVLAWIDFPILLGPAKAEQDFGDGAIALSPQAGVERAQGQDMPLPELYG